MAIKTGQDESGYRGHNESEEEKAKRLKRAWYEFNRCCYGKDGPNQCGMIGSFQITPERFICSWHHNLSQEKNNLGEFKTWLDYHYPEREKVMVAKVDEQTESTKNRYNSPWIKKPVIELWRTVRGG